MLLEQCGLNPVSMCVLCPSTRVVCLQVLQCEKDMAQKAWNYLNDSLRLDCCVRFKAELVACAAIYMAARDLRVGTGHAG